MHSSYNVCLKSERKSGGFKVEASEPDREASAVYAQTAPLLSAEAEHELAKRIKAGDPAAREALTVANMRLVVSIASQFKARGMELDDLIQEGNLGLMRATEDFDPDSHGTRFSTYASYWIRHFIMRATSDDGSMIHFPYYLATLRKRFDRVKAEMVNRRRSAPNGAWSEPTVEEVADHMGIEPRRLRFLQLAQADCSSYSTSTLDAEEAGASEDQIFEDRPPEKPIEIAEEMEGLYAAMERLPRFEAWLIKRRFRLDDRTEDAPKRGRRSRPATARDAELEARRIKRANDQADEPRSYRELERECGLAVYRLKQIEREALNKLQRALARSSHARISIPFTSDQTSRRVAGQATA